jgi:hypothetical protein
MSLVIGVKPGGDGTQVFTVVTSDPADIRKVAGDHPVTVVSI